MSLKEEQSDEYKNSRKRVRKMTAAWSHESTFILIGEVEKHECLWNHLIPEYKDRNLKDMAWTEISAVLGIPKSELPTKWNSVRGTFRVSIKSI